MAIKPATPKVGTTKRTEADRYMDEAKRDINYAFEMITHLKTLVDNGMYCQFMFDNVRNLNGAPPRVGVSVAALKSTPAGEMKVTTHMMIRPDGRTSLTNIMDGLRKAVGKEVESAEESNA